MKSLSLAIPIYSILLSMNLFHSPTVDRLSVGYSSKSCWGILGADFGRLPVSFGGGGVASGGRECPVGFPVIYLVALSLSAKFI